MCIWVYRWICDSEPYLRWSKESNNQAVKVQFKRTFKSYSFLLQKKQTDSAWNFSECQVLVWSRCFKPQFQNQCPLILLSPLSTFRSGSTKWQANMSLTTLLLLDYPKGCNLYFFRPYWAFISINFIKFSYKTLYPTMFVKHIQIYSVHISRNIFASQKKQKTKTKQTESRPFYYSI